jgi:hypothetical protein
LNLLPLLLCQGFQVGLGFSKFLRLPLQSLRLLWFIILSTKTPSYIMISIHQPERLQSENEKTGTSHVRPEESQTIPRDAQMQDLIPGKNWKTGLTDRGEEDWSSHRHPKQKNESSY